MLDAIRELVNMIERLINKQYKPEKNYMRGKKDVALHK